MKCVLQGLAFMALACAALAHAESSVWQGTIGKLQVVAKLDLDGDKPYGEYFYRSQLRDIQLSGTRLANGASEFDEAGTNGSAERDSSPGWSVRVDDNGVLKGEWHGMDGKVLPIRLFRATRQDIAPGAPVVAGLDTADGLYNSLRLAKLQLQKSGGIETVQGYAVQWWVEPRSKLTLFQFTSGYPTLALTKINAALRERHWSNIAEYFGCSGEFEQQVTPRHFGEDAISVSIFTSYSCAGAAHPDAGDAPLNLDARTGSEIDLEDVLWLGKGAPPRYDRQGNVGGNAAYFTYRENEFAPWLRDTFARIYPKQMRKSANDDACDYSDAEVWKFPTWYLTDKGIYFGPSFARAARACEYPEWSILPWKYVKPHAGAVKLLGVK